jgi:4-amino-4-deoxychorismate lyase
MFLESIKVKNGRIYHLRYHQQRLDDTFKNFYFVENKKYNLKNILKNIKKQSFFPTEQGVFKCRFLYDEHHYEVEFLPYEKTKIDTLKAVVVDDDFDYSFKYVDRKKINDFIVDNQEIVMVKSGFLTDASYANIAFFDGEKWLTPRQPLLRGTARQRLIEQQKIVEKDIALNDIKRFKKIKIFNAMMSQIIDIQYFIS